MEEKQVSIDGTTFRLPAPFMVITTQNPIDIVGTFPLPEAQIDRFMFKLDVGYLSYGDELQMLRIRNERSRPPEPKVLGREDIARLIEMTREVRVDESVLEYICDLIVASRSHEKLLLGGSPRASIALLKASKARAAIDGRDYVIPDDVKYLVPKVLAHRLIVKPELELENTTSADVIADLLDGVSVPV
jgi:MoxR-like ATPase